MQGGPANIFQRYAELIYVKKPARGGLWRGGSIKPYRIITYLQTMVLPSGLQLQIVVEL